MLNKIYPDIENDQIDRRILKTRDALENSLTALIALKGLNDISVAEIADHARVNRSTFYDHFKDKDDLFHEVIIKNYRNYIMEKLDTSNPCDEPDFKNLIIGTYEFLRYHNERCSGSLDTHRNSIETNIQEQIYLIVNRWLKNQKADDLKSTAISWAIFGSTNRLALLPKENIKRLNYIVNYLLSIL